MPRAIVLQPSDNVATLIDPGRAGESCTLSGVVRSDVRELRLASDIPFGHKICVADIASGAPVLKYGQVIGLASRPVRAGEHVHTHNVEAARGRGDQPSRSK